MNEESFNLEVRKFLKRFGVTAQREIEKCDADDPWRPSGASDRRGDRALLIVA